MLAPRLQLPLAMLPQPDETTCGPTCLHALCHYRGRNESQQDVIKRNVMDVFATRMAQRVGRLS